MKARRPGSVRALVGDVLGFIPFNRRRRALSHWRDTSRAANPKPSQATPVAHRSADRAGAPNSAYGGLPCGDPREPLVAGKELDHVFA